MRFFFFLIGYCGDGILKDGNGILREFPCFFSFSLPITRWNGLPRNEMVSRLLGSQRGEMESGALLESGNPLDSEVLVPLLASGSVSGYTVKGPRGILRSLTVCLGGSCSSLWYPTAICGAMTRFGHGRERCKIWSSETRRSTRMRRCHGF